jgi:hypothetical protein
MTIYDTAVHTVNMKALARSSVSKWTRARIADEIREGLVIPTSFTQQQLANLLGVSQGYISYVAKRHRKACSS